MAYHYYLNPPDPPGDVQKVNFINRIPVTPHNIATTPGGSTNVKPWLRYLNDDFTKCLAPSPKCHSMMLYMIKLHFPG